MWFSSLQGDLATQSEFGGDFFHSAVLCRPGGVLLAQWCLEYKISNVTAGWGAVSSAAHSHVWMGLDWDGVCLGWVEIGRRCVCVGLAGSDAAYRVREYAWVLLLFLAPSESAMATDITPRRRRSASQTTPASHPTAAAGHLPHNLWFLQRQSDCLHHRGSCTAESGGAWTSGIRSNVRRWWVFTYIYIIGQLPWALMQGDEEWREFPSSGVSSDIRHTTILLSNKVMIASLGSAVLFIIISSDDLKTKDIECWQWEHQI